jgi:hypothetical protein
MILKANMFFLQGLFMKKQNYKQFNKFSSFVFFAKFGKCDLNFEKLKLNSEHNNRYTKRIKVPTVASFLSLLEGEIKPNSKCYDTQLSSNEKNCPFSYFPHIFGEISLV